jgi:hypothetical protein
MWGEFHGYFVEQFHGSHAQRPIEKAENAGSGFKVKLNLRSCGLYFGRYSPTQSNNNQNHSIYRSKEE